MSTWHSTFEKVQQDRAVRVGAATLGRERYKLFQEDPKLQWSYQQQLYRHGVSPNKLNQEFLGKKNIEKLQYLIRREVYRRSKIEGSEGYLIGNQDETELIMIANSVYLQRSQNLPCNIQDQIDVLNKIVVDEVTPKILSEIVSYYKYLQDASTLYNENPLPLPLNVSSVGTKTYSLTNFF